MKSFSKAIDRFCYKHPRFGIPRLMLYLIIGNAIVFLVGMMDRTNSLISFLSLNPSLILRGQIWRLITFVFVPTVSPNASQILWEVFALYFYYFIGNTLENQWGTAKFSMYYLSGVVLTLVYGILVSVFTGGSYVYLDATYINLSLFFAFAVLFPDVRVYLFFILPIKVKWLALLDGVVFLYESVMSPFPYCLLPLIAFMNFFLFCGGYLLDLIRPSGYENRKQVIHFKSAVRNAKRKDSEKPYRHKCAVCGRTDADYPNLEFRYCSLCKGYHCFCEDHINNHIHFTE